MNEGRAGKVGVSGWRGRVTRIFRLIWHVSSCNCLCFFEFLVTYGLLARFFWHFVISSDNSPDSSPKYKSAKNAEMIDKAPDSGKRSLRSNSVDVSQNGHTEQGNNRSRTSGKRLSYSERSSPAAEDVSDDDGPTNVHKSQRNEFSQKSSSTRKLHGKHSSQTCSRSRSAIAGHNFSKGGKPVGITTELDSEVFSLSNLLFI